MKKIIVAAVGLFFAAGIAFAQAPASSTSSMNAAPQMSSCATKAVDKNGKPLTGAAKTSFMKKCEAGNKGAGAANCEMKAVAKNGKPLVGAAKSSFMKKCEADAAK